MAEKKTCKRACSKAKAAAKPKEPEHIGLVKRALFVVVTTMQYGRLTS